ncbi:MAG: hypothetical protein NTY91_03345 [Euryarchaeota archaeon]|nr:hypothetical protein [Euryarchaeota archaeon]
MKNQKFLKIAGVLLFSALMLIPASAALANTDRAATSLRSITDPNNIVTPPTQYTGRDLLYDNGPVDGLNGLSCIYQEGVLDREIIDEFTNTEEWTITGGEYSVLVNGGGSSITGCVVEFFEDGPSTVDYAVRTATISQVLTGAYYFGRPEIRVTCTFDEVVLAPGTWWVCFQTVHTENCFSLSAAVVGSPVYCALPDIGYPRWTPGISVFGGDYDLSWLLTGSAGPGVDDTPPVTTCTITGTNPVTITLTATDDDSGVNHTYYKIDAGSYATYTAPVVFSEVGDHIVYFYSVDKAGNVETEKNQAFTVEAPPITITIKGGFGVSATIKNTGTANLTNIDWTIALDGKLIFFGKAKSGTIAALAAGDSVTVKDFVIGFGKTGIAVTAGTASASASGTALLFFVIGVA